MLPLVASISYAISKRFETSMDVKSWHKSHAFTSNKDTNVL
jgi:hypothetical protein